MNIQNHSRYVELSIECQLTIIPNITKNNARAVQSLNKLSHSNIKVNLLGAPIDLNIDNTATGSVADINQPKSKQTKNGILNQTNGNK